jgi:hypothetical protein
VSRQFHSSPTPGKLEVSAQFHASPTPEKPDVSCQFHASPTSSIEKKTHFKHLTGGWLEPIADLIVVLFVVYLKMSEIRFRNR